MPRYYFEIEDDDFIDTEGTELANIIEAELEARLALFELHERSVTDCLTVLVKGADRRTVMRVGLRVSVDRVSG
jgi:hypothetical protein